MRGREHDAHEGALAGGDHRRSITADAIHDYRDVVGPSLEGGDCSDGEQVGEPGAPLVENDDPAKTREAAEEPLDPGLPPHNVDVPGPRGHEHHVRAAAEHLVADVSLGPLGVERLRSLHSSLPSSTE